MIRGAVPAALVLVACIHWLPAVGVLGGERLLMLYDVAADEVNLALLLRHRAVLFGVLGALLLAGAFVRALQWPALIAGLVSVGSFLLLAAAADSPNAAIQRVVVVDRWALVTLLAAMVVKVVVYRGGTPLLQRGLAVTTNEDVGGPSRPDECVVVVSRG